MPRNGFEHPQSLKDHRVIAVDHLPIGVSLKEAIINAPLTEVSGIGNVATAVQHKAHHSG